MEQANSETNPRFLKLALSTALFALAANQFNNPDLALGDSSTEIGAQNNAWREERALREPCSVEQRDFLKNTLNNGKALAARIDELFLRACAQQNSCSVPAPLPQKAADFLAAAASIAWTCPPRDISILKPDGTRVLKSAQTVSSNDGKPPFEAFFPTFWRMRGWHDPCKSFATLLHEGIHMKGHDHLITRGYRNSQLIDIIDPNDWIYTYWQSGYSACMEAPNTLNMRETSE